MVRMMHRVMDRVMDRMMMMHRPMMHRMMNGMMVLRHRKPCHGKEKETSQQEFFHFCKI
jgi:hypothetical protein